MVTAFKISNALWTVCTSQKTMFSCIHQEKQEVEGQGRWSDTYHCKHKLHTLNRALPKEMLRYAAGQWDSTDLPYSVLSKF